MADIRVRFGPGDGLLVRVGNELLFTPDGDEALVDCFRSASAGERVGAVTDLTLGGSTIGGFLAVSVGAEVRIAAFGDVEVTSDHRALPRLSAAASGTWIERTLDRVEDVGLQTTDARAVQATDLVEGCVLAGSVSIEATALAQAPAAEASPPPVQSVAPLDQPATSAAQQSSEPLPEPTTPPTSEAPTVDEPPPEVRGAETLLPRSSPPSSADDIAASMLGQEPGDALPDDATIVPDAVTRAAIDQAKASAATGLTARSRLCASCAHPNPELAVGCRWCGAPLLPGETNVDVVPIPAWIVRLDDGDQIQISSRVVVGRNPIADHGAPVIKLAGDQLSRTHLELVPDGWDLAVRDLGSTNGSFFVSSEGGEPLPIPTEAAISVVHGASILLGSRHLVVEEPGRSGG